MCVASVNGHTLQLKLMFPEELQCVSAIAKVVNFLDFEVAIGR